MKRHLCLLLTILTLCSCGAESSIAPVVESTAPAAPAFTAEQLSAFTLVGFDKEGPGDFGYKVKLNEQQHAAFVELMKAESWTLLENPPEYGLTSLLQMADSELRNILYVSDGGELGTVIIFAPQDGSERKIFTAPAAIADSTGKFADSIKAQYVKITSDASWNADQIIQAYFDAHYKSYITMQDIDISGLLDMDNPVNRNLLNWLSLLNQRRRLMKENDLCYVETEKFDYEIVYDSQPEDDRMKFWQRRMDDSYDAVYHFRIRGEEGKAYPPTFALNSQHTVFLKKIDGTWKIVRHYYPGAVRNFYFNNELVIPSDQDALEQLLEEFTISEQPAPLDVPEGALVYDAGKAVDYAMTYAEKPNPIYYNVRDWDGNCQNFVSQSVSSGFGYDGNPDPMTRKWFAGSGGGTVQWENCDYFWDYAVNNNGIGGQQLDHITQLRPGDVLQLRSLGKNDPDDFSHVIIMVDDEKCLFAQNSPSNFVYYSDLVNIASRFFRPQYLANYIKV